MNQQTTSTAQTDNETPSGLTTTLFCASPGKQPLLDNDVFNHLTTDEGNNIMYLNLSTNLTLKKKRHMYYFPKDFEKLTLDGLIDTSAVTSAISEADKIKLLSNEAIKDTGPAPNFQIMVANGQLERPIGTVLLEFEVADFQFQENFIVMNTLPNPLIGLCFLQRHNALFDIRQGIKTFPYLSMQLRPEHTTNTRVATPLLTEPIYTIQPGETLAISSKMPHLIDHNATGIVTPSSHIEEHENIFITSSLSTPIQQQIFDELTELKQLEQLNPNDDEESRKKFLDHFDWTDTTLSPFEKQHIEDILVQYHDIFARHRFDIGTNREFKVKLTPNDDRPAYSQSLPTPINLKDDITVELTLPHRYGIIIILPFSKDASPIFAQRNPNGRLRLLVDLRKTNNLTSQDYVNNNHPVSTLSDATQHMAGKKLFCKLDCSQAYHCLQMTDYQSIQMLAFNFASRTFAYRRLVLGLSRSLSAFSSFMREYLDKAIKADQCSQYVDDIGIAANDSTQLCINIKTVFECIGKAGLKLTMAKCHFGVKQVDFLGRTITPEGVSPQAEKFKQFLQKLKFPKSKKALQRYIGFLNYYRNYLPRL